MLKCECSKHFRDRARRCEAGVNFEIHNTVIPGSPTPTGQVVAILGLSGVGKTQLFRCIAGLQEPTEGGVWINDNTEPVNAGEVGVVAQDYPLIETRTVMGNLTRAFQVARRQKRGKPANVLGYVKCWSANAAQSISDAITDDKEAKALAMEYLSSFNLASVTDRYPDQLSGGQRQRIAIIQQMMCSKHFLLMDEPFSGLDVIAKESACALIQGVASQHELNTIILTTHDIRTACAVADRIIILARDKDADGNPIPGAHVVGDFDLKVEDLCWIPGITLTDKFTNYVREIERQFHEVWG